MLESGLLTRDQDRLVPNVMLTPTEEFLFAADPAMRMGEDKADDLVLWPNPTSLLLHFLAVHRPGQKTLDLGTGCGHAGGDGGGARRQGDGDGPEPPSRGIYAVQRVLNGVPRASSASPAIHSNPSKAASST